LVGNLARKADFSENNFEENFIYSKNVIWIYCMELTLSMDMKFSGTTEESCPSVIAIWRQ